MLNLHPFSFTNDEYSSVIEGPVFMGYYTAYYGNLMHSHHNIIPMILASVQVALRAEFSMCPCINNFLAESRR